jgi:hypothetical protein
VLRDSALTSRRRRLYCAPLHTLIVMRVRGSRRYRHGVVAGFTAARSRLTVGGRRLYFRPLVDGPTRAAPIFDCPYPFVLRDAGCSLKVWQVICVGTRVDALGA